MRGADYEPGTFLPSNWHMNIGMTVGCWKTQKPGENEERSSYRQKIIEKSTTKQTTYSKRNGFFNPLHPNMSMHILHTVLYTFPTELKRRICLTITSFNLELMIPSFILVRDSEVILTPNTLVLEIRFRVTKRPSKVIQFYFWLINIYTNLEGCNAFVVFGTSFRYLFS